MLKLFSKATEKADFLIRACQANYKHLTFRGEIPKTALQNGIGKTIASILDRETSDGNFHSVGSIFN